jgi:hypothetical protein
MRSTESDTGVKTEKIKTPRELTLAGADGRKTTFKVEAPARELLVESLEKGTTLMARTLDVLGETVTGTRKDFCLVSYTAVVECGGTAADRVVKVEFQPWTPKKSTTSIASISTVSRPTTKNRCPS